MGVFTLWSFVKQNRRELVEDIDLVETAKNYPDGMRLLVDFYSMESFIKEKFWQSLQLLTDNGYLVLCGGEYDLMDKFIKEIVAQLRSVNIELVLYLDGARGSGHNSTKQKMKTWQQRHFEDQRKLKKCFDFLQGQIPPEQFAFKDVPRPCLQEVQNVLSFKEAGCVLHQMVSGEADSLIAKHNLEDNKAFGTVSNDTDFCVFPGCVFLPHDMFDMFNGLGLGLKSLQPQKPSKLICGVIYPWKLINFLQLPDEHALIELAGMAGNDFTKPHLQQIPQYLATYSGQLRKLADLVRTYGRAEYCPIYGEAMTCRPGLQESMEHSRKFYNLVLEDEDQQGQNYSVSLIAEGITQCRYPSTFMAMHRGFYWQRLVLEVPSLGFPSADGSLCDLRSLLYGILVPNHRPVVHEYGRTVNNIFEEIQVPRARDNALPTLVQIVQKNSFLRNRDLFETIMSHQEYQVKGQSFFKRYGMRMGFLCYLLRYFLLMNWHRNLNLSIQEFFVVVAWTMGRHSDDKYRTMKILPSPRCVSVENWFLALYRTAYAFLGSILKLDHEFPPPRDLFSGATWVVLYTSCAVSDPNPCFRQPVPQTVSAKDLHEARMVVEKVNSDYKHVICHIVEDVFPWG